MSINTAIELKGSNFTISVLYIRHSEPEIIFQAIRYRIKQIPKFFKNAPVILNVEYLNYINVNWNKIQNAVLNNNLHIIGVSGCKDQKLRNVIEKNNLPILIENQKIKSYNYNSYNKLIKFNNENLISQTFLVNQTVRSGQKIYAKNTDLIVINNVNSGAELIADGNIHIYGRMRGKALAGANGNCDSQIFCTNLIAELISIAGKFWIMEQIPPEFFGKSARLCLQQNILTIHHLN